jgi:hypothetical protein
MIQEILKQEKRKLGIYEHLVTDLTAAQPIHIKICNYNDLNPRMLVINPRSCSNEGVESSAYFLPWRSDTGYYLDLPLMNPGANLFFTAELSGCCVGVQAFDDFIRVCHYNIQGQTFDAADFERYNSDTHIRHWLIPEKYNYDKALKYGGYSGGARPTCFWGEFEQGKWSFYYQTPDREIHSFPYK